MNELQANTSAVDNHLRFFGAITASVSHELNNVLSIVEQVTGLLEDQLIAAESGTPPTVDKLWSVHDRVLKQVERGVTIVQHMNRFAHSVDERESAADLNELIATTWVLCRRFANLKNTDLEFEPCHTTVLINESPFLLEQAFFWILKALLDADSGEGKPVRITAEASGSTATLIFRGLAEMRSVENSDALRIASAVLEPMGGQVSLEHDGERVSAIVTLSGVAVLDE